MPASQLLELFLSSQGICTDTRKLKRGQLFFALKGANFNGNKFAAKALEQGAIAAIVDEPEYNSGDSTYLVEDALMALQSLAREYRQTLSCPVLALTGSNGKTTTKELIYAVLSVHYKVHATAGNLNNHIGVPLTLLSTPSDTEILIVEMGANHIGEIKELSEIALPDYGLITNIGRAHLEGFGSVEGIIKGKTELYRHLKERDAVAFYNKSDAILCDHLPSGIQTIPYREDLQFSASQLYLSFAFGTGKPYESQLSGDYNQINIAAALTISQYFQVEDTLAAKSIVAYSPDLNRSEIKLIKGCALIMDAYNANPTSMRAAIQSLRNIQTDKKKNLILGDMKELGDETVILHREIVEYILDTQWNKVVLIGADFSRAAQDIAEIDTYANVEACLAEIDQLREEMVGALTLLKASRSLKLERLKDLV